MSHLKKGTFKVKSGDFVKQGDLLAACGNSGRSPEPHLHFQVQVAPYLGSKTIDYPFAYFEQKTPTGVQLSQFKKPTEGNLVRGVIDKKRSAMRCD
jgi:murein DD-endopeptidase MepM/ murein hydrolase activator NlpD